MRRQPPAGIALACGGRPERRTPNSRPTAGDATLPASWTEAIVFLSRRDTAFGVFLNDYIVEGLHDGVGRDPLQPDHALLPLPLPFPLAEGGRGPGAPASARRRQRAGVRRTAMRWCNRLIACLSFLDERVPRTGSWMRAGPSAWQQEVANGLLEDLLGWCRRSLGPPVERSGRVGRLEEVVRCLAKSGYEQSHDAEVLTASALPVKADRIALPAAAGGLDPALHLAPHERSLFLDWARRERPRHLPTAPVRPCHRVSAEEEAKLYLRLLDCGMARLASEAEIREARAEARAAPADWSEDLAPGGLFAVRHKPAADRLIYDRRPRNALEERFNWISLPAGCQWSQVVLDDSCCLRGSADDLSTYFYCLAQAPLGWAFNLLKGARKRRD